ncbi:MAG: hypothetical protein IEMM0007_1298 [bacterium]|nr:MAG: hypothetical protein IEMM0007_1298 [bacterium]
MLEGFKEYLLKNAGLHEKHVPYYMKWASLCYRFLDIPDEVDISG